jgi:hypothetical protein
MEAEGLRKGKEGVLDGHESGPRSLILVSLKRRNRRACSVWELCEENMRVRQELLSARAASQDLEQRALAASLMSRHSVVDVGRLLGDTPIAPQMRSGVASYLKEWVHDGASAAMEG